MAINTGVLLSLSPQDFCSEISRFSRSAVKQQASCLAGNHGSSRKSRWLVKQVPRIDMLSGDDFLHPESRPLRGRWWLQWGHSSACLCVCSRSRFATVLSTGVELDTSERGRVSRAENRRQYPKHQKPNQIGLCDSGPGPQTSANDSTVGVSIRVSNLDDRLSGHAGGVSDIWHNPYLSGMEFKSRLCFAPRNAAVICLTLLLASSSCEVKTTRSSGCRERQASKASSRCRKTIPRPFLSVALQLD